ncbi:MAG TPA: LPS export ABC transporter permease LptG [Smithellaceae bacterium]|nr:LPS export ABC transporter permease LptG [Smithellaceae bacterium]HPE07309.1 LPS export ABC transporter permease LptG [Smithellaceae bacterium]HRY38229.1 LPS export ABC transporter permease LptG [Smithellaceae bacterium]
MKLLDRYLLKTFLSFFVITCVSFIGLYLIVDFFQRFRMFLSNDATAWQMASYFLYSIPLIISLVLPAAILLASLLTYSSLSKFSEITAMKANGISLYRISLPALGVAAILSIFLFFFSELVAPFSIQKTKHIVKVDVQKQKNLGVFKQNEIWYRSHNAIYNFKMFDVEKNILRGITINHLHPDFTLKTRIDAERAEWQNNSWVFFNLLVTTFDQNQVPFLEWSNKKVIDMPEKPDDFKIIQKDAEKMGYFELNKYIKKIRSEGYDISRYLVDLYGKIAYPFVTFILVIIGMSFSLRSERSGGVMQSVGIGIFIGFSYWIVHAFSMSLGKSGMLPAFLAAWASNLLFGGIAAYLFYRLRT